MLPSEPSMSKGWSVWIQSFEHYVARHVNSAFHRDTYQRLLKMVYVPFYNAALINEKVVITICTCIQGTKGSLQR